MREVLIQSNIETLLANQGSREDVQQQHAESFAPIPELSSPNAEYEA